MELRHYYTIMRRAWWLVLGLPVLVAVLTIAVRYTLPRGYVATSAMLITQRPISTSPNLTLPDENNWYSWAASEYANDDVLQIVQTQRFASDINGWMQQNHKQQLDPAAITRSIKADRKHRTVYLNVTANDPYQALWIAQGATAMLQTNGLSYWQRQDSGTQLEVSVLDAPEKVVPAKGFAAFLVDLVLRCLLAGILAVGIAFLLHYLDRSLRQTADVEALGLSVIGTIPFEPARK